MSDAEGTDRKDGQRRDIFRKVSLDRLSSPEQLDQLMEVTTPKGWLALATVGVLIVVGIVWGIAGSISERIGGEGILIRSGGLFAVEAMSDGSVVDISVRPGDMIADGQVVARLAQYDLAEQVHQARARVAEEEKRHQRLVEYGERGLELQALHLAQSRTNLQQSIASGESTLAALEQKIQSETTLLEQGLVTRQAVLATRQQQEEVKETIRGHQAALSQLQVEELQLRNDRDVGMQQAAFALNEARRELSQLESSLRNSTEITSRYTGRVLEVLSEPGTVVSRGQPILTVDPTGRSSQNLQAVIYIASRYGKSIRPGMEIQISPSTVRKEEYGYLLARVTYVSDFPATPAGMRRVLKNDQLVATLSGTDAPYEIHADLLPDPGNLSSYRWSSSAGPPVHIHSGTLASASVVIERRRPIFMVIPQLRRHSAAEEAADPRPRAGAR
jgi:HlyD family secretion protein